MYCHRNISKIPSTDGLGPGILKPLARAQLHLEFIDLADIFLQAAAVWACPLLSQKVFGWICHCS